MLSWLFKWQRAHDAKFLESHFAWNELTCSLLGHSFLHLIINEKNVQKNQLWTEKIVQNVCTYCSYSCSAQIDRIERRLELSAAGAATSFGSKYALQLIFHMQSLFKIMILYKLIGIHQIRMNSRAWRGHGKIGDFVKLNFSMWELWGACYLNSLSLNYISMWP